jgi:hypothetical protein
MGSAKWTALQLQGKWNLLPPLASHVPNQGTQPTQLSPVAVIPSPTTSCTLLDGFPLRKVNVVVDGTSPNDDIRGAE